jgi:DNA-binding response OmpR family regulator
MTERGDAFPVVIGQSGPLQGMRWPLRKDVLLIGRGEDCDILVAERQVSRHHARLRRLADGFVVEDLGSKNGTHVNGEAVKGTARLEDGDVIQVALAAKLIFIGSEATMPLATDDGIGSARFRIDPQAHRIWVAEREIDPPLSPPQYRLLELLYHDRDRVVSRDEIVARVWPDTDVSGVSEQAIDALVRRLRERLDDLDPDHNYVVTVRGHGFRFEIAA